MSDNITDGEHQLISLLSRLVQLSSNANEKESLASTTNRLALAAVFISIGAFLTAILQAVLQYADTNDTSRRKCNASAIGRAAYGESLTQWSWRGWQKKYFYRELLVDRMRIQMCAKSPQSNSAAQRIFGFCDGFDFFDAPRLSQDFNYRWVSTYETMFNQASLHEASKPIRDGSMYFCKQVKKQQNRDTPLIADDAPFDDTMSIEENSEPWEMVEEDELPKFIRARWNLHKQLSKSDHAIRPRASWAQLFEMLEVDDFEDMTTNIVDADCISSGLDVPTQSMDFAELGLLCFLLGLDKIEINAKERLFSATSEDGAVVTETLPMVGKVLRFQMYERVLDLPWANFRYISTSVNLEEQLLGYLPPMNESKNDRDSSAFTQARLMAQQQNTMVSPTSPRDPSIVLLDWQEKVSRTTWPRIAHEAVASLLPMTIGYPGKLLLDSVLEVFRPLAKDVLTRCGETYLIRGKDSHERFGRYSKFTLLHKRALIRHVEAGKHGWAHYTVSIDTLEEQFLSGRANSRSPSYIIHSGHLYTSVHALLVSLIPLTTSSFSLSTIRTWAHTTSPSSSRLHLPDPTTLLWTQVLLLDILIARALLDITPSPSFLSTPSPSAIDTAFAKYPRNSPIRSIPRSGPHRRLILAAFTALETSLHDTHGTLFPFQNLHTNLLDAFHPDGAKTSHIDRFRIEYLADLFRLRALCWLLLVAALPDSSDVARLHLEGVKVVLPMI
ncbi:hypothetical protein BU24DRAFT_429247 [Aaosphaeria arxii CBS 175.79]|uniref:Uncharacterized protein n=1 Tax=Aaosphaeria arxii CBS 175.79 TaxID=1450172 RepID=A0A6A5X718_9PLEO|nr:uncharacterized protein BU24DRAFT_429247 [Aaosphaeria arxii CBS 175.79]KAF2008676.1 hypothetical protein BU24DRAFT_429247 [Aaosphaeria arxii CBS 175.79]